MINEVAKEPECQTEQGAVACLEQKGLVLLYFVFYFSYTWTSLNEFCALVLYAGIFSPHSCIQQVLKQENETWRKCKIK